MRHICNVASRHVEIEPRSLPLKYKSAAARHRLFMSELWLSAAIVCRSRETTGSTIYVLWPDWHNFDKKGALFFPASGVIWFPWPYTSKYLPKTWHDFIFGPYAHFLIMKFFSKYLKFFFDFLKIQRGTLWN